MANKYTLETIQRIYNDGSGEYIEIGPDADGLDLITIADVDSDGKAGGRTVTIHPDMLPLVIKALEKIQSEINISTKVKEE